MSTTFAWSFPLLEVADRSAQQPNVVVTVHWRYTASGGGVVASERGQKTLAFDPKQPFVQFDLLTPEIVAGWLSPLFDVAAMQDRLAARVARATGGPALTPKPPPWSV